jgi:hypothetical protein
VIPFGTDVPRHMILAVDRANAAEKMAEAFAMARGARAQLCRSWDSNPHAPKVAR